MFERECFQIELKEETFASKSKLWGNIFGNFIVRIAEHVICGYFSTIITPGIYIVTSYINFLTATTELQLEPIPSSVVQISLR